ncbi:MAG: BLUF domain-containing protein [Calditrichaeota bacterium]|nr:BLUF domain-containing protein [Calditrichota bacterium]
MVPLYTLIYVSSAFQKMSEPELLEILEKSRLNNSQRNITGMLLYHDGNFLQILEGPKNALQQLRATIEADPRHKDFLVLFEREVKERAFPDWSMGFRVLNADDIKEIPGFSDFMNPDTEKPDYMQTPNYIYKMLDWFRENSR